MIRRRTKKGRKSRKTEAPFVESLPKKKLDQVIEVDLGSPDEQLQLKCGLAADASDVIRRKCPIDTGAELNVMPLKLASRQG